TTAAEIRKRLAQYYQDPSHEHELRIDLPLGSYAAKFHVPVEKPAAVAIVPEAPVPAVLPGDAALPAVQRRFRVHTLVWFAVAAVVVLPAVLKFWPTHSALDRLWSPVLDSSSPVLLCVGQRPFVGFSPSEPKSSSAAVEDSETPQTTLYQLYYLGS